MVTPTYWILLLCISSISIEALTFTKRANTVPQTRRPRAPQLLQTNPFELVTQLRFRNVDYENDTAAAVTFTLPFQQDPVIRLVDPTTPNRKIQVPVLGEQERGRREEMDQYLETIYRRYRRLYDYSRGDALKVFSSTITYSFTQKKRRNKIRVFMAFCLQPWSHNK